jgi:hypothetical protein
MRQKTPRQTQSGELVAATGLVWGHLNARQFEEAYRLAKGCLRLWPEDKGLVLMAAYAAAEVLEPVDRTKLAALRSEASNAWINLVLRRADTQGAPT